MASAKGVAVIVAVAVAVRRGDSGVNVGEAVGRASDTISGVGDATAGVEDTADSGVAVTVRTAGSSAFTVAVSSRVRVGVKSWSHATTTTLAKATSNKRLLNHDFAHLIGPFAIGG